MEPLTDEERAEIAKMGQLGELYLDLREVLDKHMPVVTDEHERLAAISNLHIVASAIVSGTSRELAYVIYPFFVRIEAVAKKVLADRSGPG